jgi:hypothetical protein
MAKVILVELGPDHPIFSGKYVISSHNSRLASTPSKKSSQTATAGQGIESLTQPTKAQKK